MLNASSIAAFTQQAFRTLPASSERTVMLSLIAALEPGAFVPLLLSDVRGETTRQVGGTVVFVTQDVVMGADSEQPTKILVRLRQDSAAASAQVPLYESMMCTSPFTQFKGVIIAKICTIVMLDTNAMQLEHYRALLSQKPASVARRVSEPAHTQTCACVMM